MKPNAVHVRAIDDADVALRYLLKGGVKAVRQKYKTRRFGQHKIDQGLIEGPRCRVAHAIGPTARRDAAREAAA